MADIARAAGSPHRRCTGISTTSATSSAPPFSGVDDLETCTDRALAQPSSSTRDTLRALSRRWPNGRSRHRCGAGPVRISATSRTARSRCAPVLCCDDGPMRVLGPASGGPDASGIGSEASGPAESGRPGSPLAGSERSQLTWALLSVAGSAAVHKTRLTVERSRRTRRPRLATAGAATVAGTTAQSGHAGLTVDDEARRDPRRGVDALLRTRVRRRRRRRIGAAVGISGPSVYNHFPSKEAILVGIGQRSAARLEAG